MIWKNSPVTRLDIPNSSPASKSNSHNEPDQQRRENEHINSFMCEDTLMIDASIKEISALAVTYVKNGITKAKEKKLREIDLNEKHYLQL